MRFLASLAFFSLVSLAAAGEGELRGLTLPYMPFTGNIFFDKDLDCLDDDAEHLIAEHFKPLWIFDSRENARRENEPQMLYRVLTRTDSRRASCSGRPASIIIRYGYLFADDGGFATSTFCDNSHRGDNQALDVYVAPSADGRSFVLQAVNLSTWWWPRDKIQILDGSHPVVYLSAGKHHEYPDTTLDGTGYNHPLGCREAVDGLGARVWSQLENPNVPGGRLNVGERFAHPLNFFVGDLTALGFKGEHAWGVTEFCGGYGKYCIPGATASMSAMWGD